MKKLFVIIASLLLVSCAKAPQSTDYRVVGYLMDTGDAPLEILPAWKGMTHLNLAFVHVDADGSIYADGVRRSVAKIKDFAADNNIKLMASVGGGGGPEEQDKLATAFSDSTSRAKAIDALVALVDELSLDGIDLDYEAWNFPEERLEKIVPGVEDAFEQLRARLGEDKLITAAIASYGAYTPRMYELMDFYTVMAYDFTGPWTPEKRGQHASMEYYEYCMNFCLEGGAQADKIVMGLPFYGYGFPLEGQAYAKTYGQIVAEDPANSELDCLNDELWYNGIPTIKAKCDFVKEHGLGGVMFWQLLGDSADPELSLLNTISKEL